MTFVLALAALLTVAVEGRQASGCTSCRMVFTGPSSLIRPGISEARPGGPGDELWKLMTVAGPPQILLSGCQGNRGKASAAGGAGGLPVGGLGLIRFIG